MITGEYENYSKFWFVGHIKETIDRESNGVLLNEDEKKKTLSSNTPRSSGVHFGNDILTIRNK